MGDAAANGRSRGSEAARASAHPNLRRAYYRVDQSITIGSKLGGFGWSVNGGELLFLALATCYCNDLYREAAIRGITIHQVEVEVISEFGGRGEPASGVSYGEHRCASASQELWSDCAWESQPA